MYNPPFSNSILVLKESYSFVSYIRIYFLGSRILNIGPFSFVFLISNAPSLSLSFDPARSPSRSLLYGNVTSGWDEIKVPLAKTNFLHPCSLSLHTYRRQFLFNVFSLNIPRVSVYSLWLSEFSRGGRGGGGGARRKFLNFADFKPNVIHTPSRYLLLLLLLLGDSRGAFKNVPCRKLIREIRRENFGIVNTLRDTQRSAFQGLSN